jgi:predicted deacylase
VNLVVELGQLVERGEPVAAISDAFGSRPTRVKAAEAGWIIARTLNPLENTGDALVNIAVAGSTD